MNEKTTWVTCEGKFIDMSGLSDAERSLLREAVEIYWSTVCPGIPALAVRKPLDWTPFAEWQNREFHARGFQWKRADGTKNPLFAILQDIEGRLGIEQGKCSKPEPYCPSYWPFWA